MTVALSVISILIALGSLYLSLRTFRATRPIWRVNAGTATLVGTDSVRAAIVVEVVNVGRAGGTIQQVSVRSSDGTFCTYFDASSDNSIHGRKLPVTLAPTETGVWTFDYTRISARLKQTDRRYATTLKATIKSGVDEYHSHPVSVGSTDLPMPPIPFARAPRWLRPVLARAASAVRQRRSPQPQLLGLMILDPEVLKAGKVPVQVRNFGTGTARDLVVDMVASKGGTETRVEGVLPQHLKKLAPKREHTFTFTAENAAPRAIEGVEYWWRLHVGAKPSGVKVGVTTRDRLEEVISMLDP